MQTLRFMFVASLLRRSSDSQDAQLSQRPRNALPAEIMSAVAQLYEVKS